MVRKITFVFITLTGVLALLGVDRYFHAGHELEDKNTLQRIQGVIHERLSLFVRERIISSENTQAFFVNPGELPDKEQLLRLGRVLERNQKDIEQIVLLDHKLEVRSWLSITESVKNTHLDASVRQQQSFVRQAVSFKETIVGDPLFSSIEKKLLYIWVPLYANEKLIGVLGFLYNLSPLLASLDKPWGERIRLTLRDRFGKVFYGQVPKHGDAIPALVSMRNNHWMMSVEWSNTVPVGRLHEIFLIWVLGGGFLLLLLLLIRYSWGRQEQLAHDVEIKNSELKKVNQDLVYAINSKSNSEKALLESEARFRATFDQAAVGIALASLDGFIFRANQKFCEIVGYGEKELNRLSFKKITHEDDLRLDMQNVEKLLRGDIENYSMIKRYYRKDGEIVWVNLSTSLVRDVSGNPAYMVGVVEDITPRLNAEEAARLRQEELTHASRLATMGEMASGLAHEINQPLSAIVNYSRGCLRRLDSGNLDESEQRKVVELISEQADRAAEIMKRLRNFVRKAKPVRQAVDVVQVINNIKRFIEKEAREKKVEIHVLLEKNLPKVYADPIQVEQVLLNLARNAIDSMMNPEVVKRELYINACQPGKQYVEISVRDTGVGIPDESTGTIFDPFYSTKKDGTGLGLSISQSLIEAHEGRLWVERAFTGEGVEFFFTLPIYSGDSDE